MRTYYIAQGTLIMTGDLNGKEIQKKRDICVYIYIYIYIYTYIHIWLIHFVTQQKLSQQYKAIISSGQSLSHV